MNPKLAQALSGVVNQVGVLKAKSDNPFFHSKYISLEDLIKELQPLLQTHGLVVNQFPDETSPQQVAVTTIVTHIETGDSLEYKGTLTIAKADPQGSGSAITYLKRYALGSIFMVVTDKDDDANSVSPHTTAQAQPRTSQASSPPQQGTAPQGGGGGGRFVKCDPMPSGGYRCKIREVKHREGQSKAGKPYTMIHISSEDNYECTCFNDAKLKNDLSFLESIAGTGQEIIIHTTRNGNYSNYASYEKIAEQFQETMIGNGVDDDDVPF